MSAIEDLKALQAEKEGLQSSTYEVESELLNQDARLEFPVGALPDFFQLYVLESAKSMQCPTGFIALPLLAIAGAAIGKSYAFSPKAGILQFPALYTAIVGKPGSTKSPALVAASIGLNHEFRKRKEQFDYDLELFSEKEKAAKQQKQTHEEIRPILVRRSISDATVEAIAPLIDQNPKGIILHRDELSGWLGSMNAYKSGKGSDRQFFLQTWSFSQIAVDRKQSVDPIVVPEPFLAITGTIQPDTLKTLRNDQKHDDGFVDRFLFYHAPEQVGDKFWSDSEVSERTSSKLIQIFEKLYELEVNDGPIILRFSLEAKTTFVEWFNQNQNEPQQDDFSEQLRGVWAKLPLQLYRIITILHVVENIDVSSGIPTEVSLSTLVNAIHIVEVLSLHQAVAAEVIHENDFEKSIRKVISYIQRKGLKEVSARMLHKAGVVSNTKQAESVLASLIEKGFAVAGNRKSASGQTRSFSAVMLPDTQQP